MNLSNEELDMNKLVKYIIKNFFINYKKGIVGAFIVGIVLFIPITNVDLHRASLIDLFQSVYSDNLILITFILLFIFVISNIFKVYDKNILLIRCFNLHTWCYQKILTCVYVVFIYLFFINFPFLFSLIIHHFIGSITFDFIRFWMISILFQGIGLIIIGSLYLLIRNLTGHNVISSVLTYLMISIPNLIQGLFYVRVYSFVDYMFLNNLNKDSTIVSIFVLLIVFVIIEMLLLYLNLNIVQEKDIYLE